ncbi:hypothetical protein [Bacillus sp. FSL K6-6540]|uniref:hypothetical protein n=1 Tax=Bacillus sp. FSL K6-6540 TaxID=2921512 RepID=UPI0030F55236
MDDIEYVIDLLKLNWNYSSICLLQETDESFLFSAMSPYRVFRVELKVIKTSVVRDDWEFYERYPGCNWEYVDHIGPIDVDGEENYSAQILNDW